MKYLLLLYGDRAAEAALNDAERRAIVDEHIRFGRVLDERNAIDLAKLVPRSPGLVAELHPIAGS